MIFITGATGYIGSYVVAALLREHRDSLALLVRARDRDHALQRLWQALQIHMPFEEFDDLARGRLHIVLGDLTDADLSLDASQWRATATAIESVIHIAASLNRKSAKACFNVNLRGTLSVIRLARDANEHHGLRRFSDVSTVAVAGHRAHETVTEDATIDWNRSDYDPYARTKKFCEHMLHELLPGVPQTIFRPSTVLGDSRFAATTQFDMVRAFVMLARMPVLPLDGAWRMDIVPADYVADGIVTVHQDPSPRFDAYNLSAGESSLTYRQIVAAMAASGHRIRNPLFAPGLARPFTAAVDSLSNAPKSLGVGLPASLMKVFLPYLVYDTVFDNARIVDALGRSPTPFSEYAWPLFKFATDNHFRYPHEPWPDSVKPWGAATAIPGAA